MARDPQHDILFEPVKIGPKTLRNRFYQTAHCSGAGSEKPGMQAALRGTKAEGGWAAVTTEYCSVSPESDDFNRIGARLWDEGDIRNLALMVDAAHEHDALAAVELVHGSVDAPAYESRMPARGVSQVQSKYEYLRTPKALDREEIREIQQEIVEGAKRARATGFDILTIYMAMAQGFTHHFFLPHFNQRTDEYGGSFENRARFTREVLEMVRDEIGDECAISLRFGIDTLPAPDGLGDGGVRAHDEGCRFVELVDHLVDFWDIQLSWAGGWSEDAGPSRTHRENHGEQYLQGIADHTTKPVMNVGRFTDADTMANIIRNGQCDLIGAARPSIADPFLPKKIQEGRYEDIRECIGCNACVARWSQAGPAIVCTQNATMGEEHRRGWHPEHYSTAANRDKNVLIVGGGPAGLEAAVVLGKREMQGVHLVEAEGAMGGHLRWMTQMPGLSVWGRVIDYRETQIAKLSNVEAITGHRLDANDVLEYGAEIVIVATGSHWAGDGLNGPTQRPVPGADASQPHVLTPEQVMAGKPVGRRVVVFDTDGYHIGATVAQKLAEDGCDVTFVTTHQMMAPYTLFTLEASRLNRGLRTMGVQVLTEHLLTDVSPDKVTVIDFWNPADPRTLETDSVVLATQRLSDVGLHEELRLRSDDRKDAGIEGLHLIGDAYAPQMLADTIFHAHRLAREIDSPDPRTPLPFIRERRLVGSTSDDDFRVGSAVHQVPVL